MTEQFGSLPEQDSFMIMSLLLSGLLLVTMSPGCPLQDPAQQNEVAGLGDEELVRHFRETGLTIESPQTVPADRTLYATGRPGGTPEHFGAMREIIRRGSVMIPHLLRELGQEVPMNRQHANGNVVISMTGELCDMLWQIGDPAGAEPLIFIVEGFQGMASEDEQRRALDALERLTYCSFRNMNTESRLSVAASQVFRYDDYPAIAAACRDFIATHGIDRDSWLRDAQRRAREMLASDDPALMFPAIEFLGFSWEMPGGPVLTQDDDPEATAARIVEILQQFRWTGEKWVFVSDGGELDIGNDMWNWLDRASHYGPRVRGIVPKIIENQQTIGYQEWSSYDFLRDIGGSDAMAYLIEAMRVIDDATDGADFDQPLASDSPVLEWRNAERQCSMAISRWAGRIFETPEEREQWWGDNAHKSEEDWLRSGLPIAAEQSNRRVKYADLIFFQVVPAIARQSMIDPGAVDRQEWVDEVLPRAKYVPERGVFISPEEAGDE